MPFLLQSLLSLNVASTTLRALSCGFHQAMLENGNGIRDGGPSWHHLDGGLEDIGVVRHDRMWSLHTEYSDDLGMDSVNHAYSNRNTHDDMRETRR